MGDERLDQFSTGSAEGFGAAEVRGICLHEIRIEVVPADEKAELIPQPGLTIGRAIIGTRFLRTPDDQSRN